MEFGIDSGWYPGWILGEFCVESGGVNYGMDSVVDSGCMLW